jgi:hypothetical protein
MSIEIVFAMPMAWSLRPLSVFSWSWWLAIVAVAFTTLFWDPEAASLTTATIDYKSYM